MNVTLSIDETLGERARALAKGRGKTLEQLILDLLAAETGTLDTEDRIKMLDALWSKQLGDSKGAKFKREDAYADRMRKQRK